MLSLLITHALPSTLSGASTFSFCLVSIFVIFGVATLSGVSGILSFVVIYPATSDAATVSGLAR